MIPANSEAPAMSCSYCFCGPCLGTVRRLVILGMLHLAFRYAHVVDRKLRASLYTQLEDCNHGEITRRDGSPVDSRLSAMDGAVLPYYSCRYVK